MTSFDLEKLRSISLLQLLASFGLRGKREGSSVKFTSVSHTINVTGNLWYDHKNGAGGGGAIDLVMYLRDCSFPEACSALGSLELELPSYAVVPLRYASQSQTRSSFDEQMAYYARKDIKGWPAARHYLLEERKLPPAQIIRLHRKGDIFATRRGSVAFLHRTLSGAVAGCTLRGYSPGSEFKQCLGNKIQAWFSLGDLTQSKRAVLVESPIEALSYDALHPGNKDAIISVSGMYVPNLLLETLYNCGHQVIVAFNADKAGLQGLDQVTRDWNLLEQAKGCKLQVPSHEMPATANDWNEVLRSLPSTIRIQGDKGFSQSP